MRHHVVVIFAAVFLCHCGGRSHTDDVDDFGADDVFDTVHAADGTPRVEQVALATEIDTITFAPIGPTGTSFPASTQRLFLCFRVRGAPEGANLAVAWYRAGEREPLSVTRDVIAGDARLAAEHSVTRPFRPGPHYVRVDVDRLEVARVEFQIEGEGGDASRFTSTSTSTSAAVVEGLGVFGALDRRGRPAGQPAQRFDVGVRSLHCAFRVRHAAPGTKIQVGWSREGTREAVTDVGEIEGDRTLSASIGGGSTLLPAGDYVVEVLVDGVRGASRGFIIGANQGARQLHDLVLTTAIDPRSQRPAAPPRTAFEGSEPTLYLSVSYEGMSAGDVIEVRWIQDSMPDEPMAISTVQTRRSGQMSASFSPDGPLPPGDYHADVVLGDEVLDMVSFTVGSP